MLLPVDLMSVVSAGSVTANASEGSHGDSSAAPSWLLAADTDLSEKSGKDLINQIFQSYTDGGEVNPETRFAANLKEMLQAHGITLPADRSLLANAVSLASGQLSADSTELDWSVDELLQMSMSPLAGGNNLPLDDQTLPSVLSGWLATLSSGTTTPAVGAEASGLNPGSAGSALSGDNEPVGQLATLVTETRPMSQTAASAASQPATNGLAIGAPGSLPDSLLANTAGAVAAVNTPADISGDIDAATLDAEPAGAVLLSRTAGGGNPASDQDIALRSAVVEDATRRSAEAAQLSSGPQKTSSDAVSASAFRSIQFNPSANGETAATIDGQLGNQADQGRVGALQERIQAIVGQQGISSTSSVEVPAGNGSSQAFNPTDGIAVVNRAEQRMFATETAQQAQSQAAQHTAARTADGLPRFAMDTAFGQQGWSDSLGRQLLVMNSQGVSSAQIRLDPPELGSLTVKIQMSADQQTTVSFVSQHAVVREALEQQLNRLQDLFRDQGLNLQDVSVSDQSPQQRDGNEPGQQGGGGNAGTGEHEAQAAEPALVRSESLIDFYA